MPITIRRGPPKQTQSAGTPQTTHRKRTPRKLPLKISLDQPGRVRVGHMLELLSTSHATFYRKMKEGIYPGPDGYDGPRPYWRTETVRELLSQ